MDYLWILAEFGVFLLSCVISISAEKIVELQVQGRIEARNSLELHRSLLSVLCDSEAVARLCTLVTWRSLRSHDQLGERHRAHRSRPVPQNAPDEEDNSCSHQPPTLKEDRAKDALEPELTHARPRRIP